MCSWCLSDFLLMVSVEPDPDDVFPLRRRSEGQPPARLGGVRNQAEPGSSGAVLRLGLLRSFCQYSPRPCRRHMSLFLAPVSWVEWRSERSLEVDSEPLTGVGTKCGPGVPGPPVLRSRKPWQDPLDGWGFWEPGMQKTLHSGPSGWCLPFSHGLALSEPDWTGTPGDSSSLPHLTRWWPGLQGQPQTL